MVDSGAAATVLLVESLSIEGFDLVGRVTSCDKLVNDIQQLSPDVVVIDMESPDDHIFEQLIEVNDQCPIPVVLFSENGETNIIKKAVKANVGAFIVDGLTERRVRPIIELAIERFKEIRSLQSELTDTKKRLEDRKMIEKAKGILMQRNSVSEDDAYQSLRKLAMKQNKKLVDVAQNVIELSDVLQ